jgi:hypothetical protein
VRADLPTRERVLRALPSALLLVLAGVQIALVAGFQLSPWKGGGFGMFATNDQGAFRTLRAFALRPGGEVPLELPPQLRRLELRTRELPTRAALRRFAAALSAYAPDAPAIRAECWRTSFDADLRPLQRELAEATWSRAP